MKPTRRLTIFFRLSFNLPKETLLHLTPLIVLDVSVFPAFSSRAVVSGTAPLFPNGFYFGAFPPPPHHSQTGFFLRFLLFISGIIFFFSSMPSFLFTFFVLSSKHRRLGASICKDYRCQTFFFYIMIECNEHSWCKREGVSRIDDSQFSPFMTVSLKFSKSFTDTSTSVPSGSPVEKRRARSMYNINTLRSFNSPRLQMLQRHRTSDVHSHTT